ncbi:glutamate-1-semialdehyde 2,1-aminomutase [Phocicoccus pinnipedialis]|uniref:Glutamate-1-semialdehyde 2,1-aminomutase n=1 Tax=Phocicoccus pinnipedialis TaxID=110845 RepID=A0A6V7RCC4_9BACL|nr:glutamate-1-semialdehyde 2,1-aminomutase [Jeotgalicoccus pinnipedialis]MBP1939445.1 glutamate-1-semialdehyde 2,1-aminomutase [Jeotgalicoccus pinnipedialis]CAD2075384.1 Glutamate-1-semialdehyde 2,1-aminomutase 1 [Jeotgalicoccus pinnipedialis]
MNFETSKTLFKDAVELMPGGVSSPVRAFKSVKMNPIFVESATGVMVKDVDGNEYIDYVLSWGPLILGHSNDQVVKRIQEQAVKGTSFGAPTELENKLAEIVIDRVPSIEMVRFVSSGTEATLSALRLARGYTDRNKILKFEGCYHGHSDSLLIKAGSGVATLGLPDSPGVPEGVASNTITVPYNDKESLKEAFDKFGDDIAAVIMEPVAGNMGVVPPVNDFLHFVRDITEQNGTLLIFDEVMTGFRVSYHSAQGYYGVTPDLTCLGKVIGGGLPVGAYGGKREIMEHVAPVGTIYQAGTLSGNPLAMTAGIETLSQLTEESYDHFNMLGDIIEEELPKIFEKYSEKITINRAGSMIGFFLTEGPVKNFDDANRSDLDLFARLFQELLKEGVYLPPSQFEGMFLSTAHTKEHIETTLKAFDNALRRIKSK